MSYSICGTCRLLQPPNKPNVCSHCNSTNIKTYVDAFLTPSYPERIKKLEESNDISFDLFCHEYLPALFENDGCIG